MDQLQMNSWGERVYGFLGASLARKINLVVLVILSLASWRDPSVILIGVFAALVAISGISAGPNLIAAASLLTLLILPRHLSVDRGPSGPNVFESLQIFDISDMPAAWLLEIGIHAVSLLVLWFTIRLLVRHAPSWLSFQRLGLVLIGVWFLSKNFLIGVDPWLAFILFSVLALLTRSLLSALLFLNHHKQDTFRFRDLFWIQPFWVLNLPHWNPHRLEAPQERSAREQYSVLLELLLAAAALVLVRGLGHLFFSPNFLGLVNFNEIGFHRLPLTEARAGSLWVSFIYAGLLFIVERLWVIISLPYFLFHILGYSFPQPFRNPLVSTSFADFFGRTMFFYNRALLQLTYFPIYKRLQNFPIRRSSRKILTSLLAIFIFSEIFHILRDYWVFLLPGPPNAAAIYFAEFSVYSALLSLSLTASIYLKDLWPNRPAWSRIVFIPFYFLIYCFLIQFGAIYREGLPEKLQAFRALFYMN